MYVDVLSAHKPFDQLMQETGIIRADSNIDGRQSLPYMMMTAIHDGHAQRQTIFGFNAYQTLHCLDHIIIFSASNCHAVDNTAISLKTATVNKCDLLAQELSFRLIAVGQASQIFLREINIEVCQLGQSARTCCASLRKSQ